MTGFRSIARRVMSLLRRRALDGRLDEEVRAHLELLTAEHMRRGLPIDRAQLAARRDFGGIEPMKEMHRDRRGLRWMEDVHRDLRNAVRGLWRSPIVTGAAVLTLAVGLTAVTAIFGILNAFMFRPMPVDRPEQLVSIGTGPDTHVQIPHGLSFQDLQDYRKERSTFVDLLGYTAAVGGLNVDDTTDRITMYAVTDNYFSLLGVQPATGRLIQPNEGRARGDAAVLVLTHEYWRARFDSDPSIVGRTVRLNGHPFTIVGVAPESFDKAHTLIHPSAYFPLWMYDDVMSLPEPSLENRGSHQLWVLGRLQPGVSLSQARATLEVASAGLAREYPSTNKDSTLVVVSEMHARPNPNIGAFIRVAGTAFAALAVLLLLITSANVANLLLARAMSREREVSLRAALGAGRGRLVSQLLTESMVLALFAGAIAVPVAAIAMRNFARAMTASTEIVALRADVSLDAGVIAVVLLMTALAGIAAGLAPALMGTRGDLAAALRAAGRPATRDRRALFRGALVAGQVALSLMLLVSGGLFMRSLDRARQVELGFDPRALFVATAVPNESGYDDAERRAYYTTARERVAALPGVARAAWTEWVPLATVTGSANIWQESRPPRPDEQPPIAAAARVDPGYFAVADIPILDGRGFTERDDAAAPPVAIVNQTLAHQFWPGQNVVGRFFMMERERVEVVGLVPDGKYYFVWEPSRPMVFRPLAQGVPQRATLVVRSDRASSDLLAEIQRSLREADPAVFVYDARTMDEHLRSEAGAFAAFEIGAAVTSIFGVAGALLAAVGLFGMVAGQVSQRSREFGVRIALGANRATILRDVLGRAVRLGAAGIAVGALLTLFAAQGLRTMLLDVSPFDPLTYVTVASGLVAVCLIASFIPARRATRVDPIIALRAE